MKSKLIVIIGYGFGDEHINGLLSQALKQDRNRKIFYVSKSNDENFVMTKLSCNSAQIIIEKYNAKEFFEKKLQLYEFETHFPEMEDDIFGD